MIFSLLFCCFFTQKSDTTIIKFCDTEYNLKIADVEKFALKKHVHYNRGAQALGKEICSECFESKNGNKVVCLSTGNNVNTDSDNIDSTFKKRLGNTNATFYLIHNDNFKWWEAVLENDGCDIKWTLTFKRNEMPYAEEFIKSTSFEK
ncbi:MAG: hypothetical protein BGO69_12775 [Bacteroidetes bacterium 46-16]|nr:MAG: hypothetical protein BGO69_12775 [Bacteroidetes bacterium 46-16]